MSVRILKGSRVAERESLSRDTRKGTFDPGQRPSVSRDIFPEHSVCEVVFPGMLCVTEEGQSSGSGLQVFQLP